MQSRSCNFNPQFSGKYGRMHRYVTVLVHVEMGFSLDFILKVFTPSPSNAKLSLARSAVISFTAGPRELWESLIITNRPITTAMTTKELAQIMITIVTGKFSLSAIASDGSEKTQKIHKLQRF